MLTANATRGGLRERLRLTGWRLWLLVAVVLYTLAGFFLLPWLLRQQAPAIAHDTLGLELEVERVRMNPFLFRISIEGLVVSDAETGPLLRLDRLFADFQLASAWRRVWTFREIAVDAPKADFRRLEDGSTNVGVILDRLPPTPDDVSAADASPPRLAIQTFSLTDGQLQVRDETRSTPWLHTFGPISVVMDGFATLAGEQGQYRLDARTQRGGRVEWNGTLSVDPLRSAGSLELKSIELTSFWAYASDAIDADLQSALLSLGLNYDADASASDVSLRVSDGRIDVQDLALSRRSTGDELIRLPGLSVAGANFDLQALTLAIAEVAVQAPYLDVRREEDGELEWVRILSRPGAQSFDSENAMTAPAPAGDDAEADALKVSVNAIDIRDGGVSIEDRTVAQPMRVDLEDIELLLSDYRSEGGHVAEFSFATGFASGGELTASGAMRGVPLDIGLDIEVTSLSLLPFLPYAEDLFALEIDALSAGAAGQISVTGAEPFAFTGSATLEGLSSRLPGMEVPVIRWRRLGGEGIDVSAARRNVRIGTLLLSEPFVQVRINEQGDFNLASIVMSDPDADPVATSHEAPTGGETAPPFTVGVGQVEIAAGEMDFEDLNLPLPFAALVDSMEGSVSAITSEGTTPARVEMDGTVNSFGAATIRGALDVFDPARTMDLEMDFRNIAMPNLTPYLVKFAGREIDDGRLDVDLSWSIRDGQLQAGNRMTIRDLRLGTKVEAPDAMSLPLDLAVALLTDRNGVIDLDIPVTGDLDDPEFGYASLVFRALGNVLGRIVTAPFRFLASLLGDEASEGRLEFVGFVAGDATVMGPEAEDLEQLASVLSDRPELTLEIGAAFDPVRDDTVMRSRSLDAQVAARFEAGDAAGLDDDPVRAILERIYSQSAGAESLADLQARFTVHAEAAEQASFDEQGYIEALRSELLALQPVGVEDLERLAQARAGAVRDYLVSNGGMDDGRLKVGAPGEAPRADENLVYLKLGVTVD